MKKIIIQICVALVLTSCFSREQTIQPTGVNGVDDLTMVSCTLPGQLRQLGTSMRYMSRGRVIKATARNCMLRGGEFVVADRATLSEALKTWLEAANADDVKAMSIVGELYEQHTKYDSAAFWYEKAAKKGSKRSQVNLGQLYEKGLGVEQDKLKALALYRKASGLSEKINFISNFASDREKYLQKSEQQQQKISQLKQVLQDKESIIRDSGDKITRLNESLGKLTAGVKSTTQSTEVNALKATIIKQTHQIESATSRVEQLKNQLKTLQNDSQAIPPPKIEIIDPPLMLTRSTNLPFAKLTKKLDVRSVTGRILSSIGIKYAAINGKTFQLSNGLFKEYVDITGYETPIHIKAVDERNQQSELIFRMITDLNPTEKLSVDTGQYYALIIGNNQYEHMGNLMTAINDAKVINQILSTKYGFETELLLNANRYQILSAINHFRQKLNVNDKLIIYYGGHGELGDDHEKGYWLPSDADIVNKTNWISNSEISEQISEMKARQVMVIADSCYSGTMSTLSLPRPSMDFTAVERKEYYELLNQIQSRTVLTSGGLKPVLDSTSSQSSAQNLSHSIFANALINVLSENTGTIEGYQIYQRLVGIVTTEAGLHNIDQTPNYSPISHAGHESGDMFFEAQ